MNGIGKKAFVVYACAIKISTEMRRTCIEADTGVAQDMKWADLLWFFISC
jgi:hypothetical protein